jgi:hypothetical protein
VFTTCVTGLSVTDWIAALSSRAIAGFSRVSITSTPRRPTMNPVLLPPEGPIHAYTSCPSGTMSSVPRVTAVAVPGAIVLSDRSRVPSLS